MIPSRSSSESTPEGSGPPADISVPVRPNPVVSGRSDIAVKGLSLVYRESAVLGLE